MRNVILRSVYNATYDLCVNIKYYENEIILNDTVILDKSLIDQLIEELKNYNENKFTFSKQ